MRIHHLHIEAIGPFPGRHDIDFDTLSAGGLFLLEGPTGAGKSTLIDAITYGLYGTLGKALDSRLPSAHAPLADPVIEVVFSTNAGIYKTRRTPPWDRPKKRGDGFTPQNATAKLWRLSSVEDTIGEPVAGSAQEVGAEMQRILGLTRDQFMQTVVLPQGRFSTFLRAKPDERAAVLRDVFGTAIYQAVQDQLAEMARTARRDITVAQGEVSSALRSFAGLLADDDPAVRELWEAGSALDSDEMTRLADNVQAGLGRQCAEADGVLTVKHAEEVAARAVLETRKELHRALLRRSSLMAENAGLLQEGEGIAMDRDRLAGAQRAATVAGALRSHAAATSGMERASQAVTTACSEVRLSVDDDLAEVSDIPTLRATIDHVTGERGGLMELVRLEAELPARALELGSDEARLGLSRAALEEKRAQLGSRPAVRDGLTNALEDLRYTATPVAVAHQVMEQRRAIRDAAHRASALAKQLAEALASLTRAGDVARTATEQESVIRLRWINSTAGSLAADLEDGCPCPVCGGTEHPSPAPELPGHASLEDADAATKRRQQAVSALQEADRAHVRLAGDLTAQQEAARHTGLRDADTALAVAEADVCTAQETVRLITMAEKAVVEFDAGTDTIRAGVAAAETSTATTAERLRGERQRLHADEGRCRLAATDCGSVAVRVELLDARLARARQLVGTRQEHHDAEYRLTDASATLDEALRDATFSDADAARAAQMGTLESAELHQRLRRYDADLARVSNGLAEEAVASLTGDEVADVPAAAAAHDACQHALMAASAAGATAAAALEQCDRARRVLVKVLARHQRLAEDAAPVVRMGELANAGEGNVKSTTLSTFVLLRRFEDVVAAANDRLTVMSDGRFALLRIDEREGRARRAGLGLTVRDHHTETNRDPHTLSGGETFYVSLCLALGLADVVTSEAGGISLDTLFIDEGFGSLDSETLDGVLGELAHLQAGGRAVGIVSHVAELKARIPERVEITRRADGGSTLVVRA
ncbi:AAA family ATPase [Tessaracoccus antarcticus]|uniref:Nuclease SbcCD subunit C n=1 Tax=Tessaracoccus antarcticus TaxID=2479848 RepID=A0A3M0G8S9_9ACTN|nr:SMC family ATPase [Tessaracoccus antarcticus]RMB61385.1 SMC family ATPase [Tessaracoccus antarcticus]